jgi:hypothetical protein
MTAWILVAVALVFAVLLVVGLQEHARTFQSSIVKLQLAGTGHAVGGLLDRLDADDRDGLPRALRIDDTLIVPGYTGLLVSLCALSVVWVRAAAGGALEVVGIALALASALLAVVAGVLDLLENRALRGVHDAWHRIPIPTAPDETEAAGRQEQRRAQVAAIDPASRTARRATLWKLRLLAVVLAWVLVAVVVAATDTLSR